ncbi:8412_t:CDS:2, partial [Ambispora gerdemannii]
IVLMRFQKECQTATIIETCGGKRENLMGRSNLVADINCYSYIRLPYVLVKGIAIDDYEERVEKFNIHGCWEWLNGEVLIYELPSMPHEVCISAIVKQINRQCSNADGTNAEIHGAGSTRTRDRNRGKEADASFRPKKLAVTAPNGSNRDNRPWPNLVVEVAYTETLDHAEEVLKYWMSPGRSHDCIIVKIDLVPQDRVPVHMRAWHYCVSAGRGSRNTVPLVTTVMLDYSNLFFC